MTAGLDVLDLVRPDVVAAMSDADLDALAVSLGEQRAELVAAFRGAALVVAGEQTRRAERAAVERAGRPTQQLL